MSTALRTYFRGRNLVSMRDGRSGLPGYYHFDRQGTTQCLSDSAGAVADRFACDAWGVQVNRSGNSINRNWYVGNLGYARQVDQLSSYVRARYLSPAGGTWLSRDPLTAPRVPYQYADNRPAILTDPSGLSPRCRVSKTISKGPLDTIVSPPPAWFEANSAWTMLSFHERQNQVEVTCPANGNSCVGVRPDIQFCQAYKCTARATIPVNGNFQQNALWISINSWCPDALNPLVLDPFNGGQITDANCNRTRSPIVPSVDTRYALLGPPVPQPPGNQFVCKFSMCMFDAPGISEQSGVVPISAGCTPTSLVALKAIEMDELTMPFSYSLMLQTWMCDPNDPKYLSQDGWSAFWGIQVSASVAIPKRKLNYTAKDPGSGVWFSDWPGK